MVFMSDEDRRAAFKRRSYIDSRPPVATRPPVMQTTESVTTTEEVKQKKSRPNFQKRYFAIAGGIIIIAGLVAGGMAWKQHVADANNPIPKSARKGLTFQLYYPTKLPAGYYVKEDSFENKDGSLIFYIVTPDNKAIGVSEQPLPTGVTLPQSSSGPIKVPGEADFVSAIGHAHISLEGKNYVSETVTQGGVWIIMNVSGLTLKDATALTQSFTAVR